MRTSTGTLGLLSWWRFYLLLVAVPFAVTLGARWNSTAVPIRGVTLTTRAGDISGDLYRLFDGAYVVQSPGSRTVILEKAVITILMPAAQLDRGSGWLFAARNWRCFVPPALVFALLFVEAYVQAVRAHRQMTASAAGAT